MPPSIAKSDPVMNEASSLLRKRTSLATSSGRPTRPTGCISPQLPMSSSTRAGSIAAGRDLYNRSVDRPWGDRVAAYAILRIIDGYRSRERENATFRC